MAVLYTNNAVSALSASITNVATSLSVTAGHGARFPAIAGGNYFYVTLLDTAGNLEIVKVTARSTDTFTVARAQDGTTARAFAAGDFVELRITKAMLDDFKTDTLPAATTTVRGGIELGSDTAQTVAANAVTATASRTYALQVNAAGQGLVNVPWTDTTYSLATSTVLGLIELGSDTQQTVASNAVTATASRSYALQVNAAGQGVVNVPWTNSGGTVTSVGGTGTVSGLTLTGTVTASGNLTLGGTLAVLPSNFASQTANTVLAAPNGAAGVPTFRAIVAADIPTLNQNTTGTSSNVTGTVAVANGGTGATTAAAARTNLGATTLGGNLYTLANVAAISFPRFNADNTVSSLDAATFRTAIGAGTGSGTVTSVSGTGTVSGLTLTGTVTTSGSLTLGGTLSVAALSTASGSAPSYSARAWVNFNGTGTVAIRASGNVSSITDNGTGDYTVNFTTAMADVNYAVVATAAPSDNQRNNVTIGLSANNGPTLAPESNTKFAGSFRMQTGLPGSTTFVDHASIYAAVFR
jgi:hypothetical protein